MTECRNAFQVNYVKLWVTYKLRENRLCVFIEKRLDVLRGNRLGKSRLNAESLKVAEKVYRSAEKSCSGDYLITRVKYI